MINDLPTIFEVVTGSAKKQTKEKSSENNGNKSKSSSKGVRKHLVTSAHPCIFLGFFKIIFNIIIVLFIAHALVTIEGPYIWSE